MTRQYDPKDIEPKWQKAWEKQGIYATKETADKPKYYVLDMFPYPSGEGLHVGHPKGYIATDVISRMKRMQGFNVLHPMGFDAFGLPAEQYAIKMKTNPAVAVEKNVARYKKQLEILGFDYDWSREVNTTDPKYYKWTQWIFLKLLEKGLAEERYEPINWCPVDKTGLANEDIEDGKCERCGAVVEKRLMKQWVLKITQYADRLLSDLDAKKEDGTPLLDWPESIKESQRNWIGRSEGAEIDFKLIEAGSKNEIACATVFTTRADTLFGVTYVVLAPEHSLVAELLEKSSNKKEIEAYISMTKAKTEIDRTDTTKEKTGVELKGVRAINPANNEEVPVWIADYVLADYGTGAVMAVPAHDERDFVFAKKFALPIKHVVAPYHIQGGKHVPREGIETLTRRTVTVILENKKNEVLIIAEPDTTTLLGGGIEEGEMPTETALREIKEETGYADVEVKETILDNFFAKGYRYTKGKNTFTNDYIIHAVLKSDTQEKSEIDEGRHHIKWVPKENVLNEIPHTHSHYEIFKLFLKPHHTGDGLLVNSCSFDGKNSSDEVRKEITKHVGGRWVTKYKLRDWVFSRQRYWGEPIPVVHDENGLVIPLKEEDLPLELPMVEHYEPTDTGESPLANIPEWAEFEVDGYKFKRETNTMPQWAGSSWYYLRYMDPHNDTTLVDSEKEKYWNSVDLYVGGAEHATRHLIYARFWHKFLYDIGVVSTLEPFTKLANQGLITASDGRKMSKRWGNVVNPDEMVDTFGADSMRLYEMFMGPFDQAIAWNTNGVVGTRRFIEKVWKLSSKVTHDAPSHPALHRTIKKVSEDIAGMKFNTAISSMMIFVNDLEKAASVSCADMEALLKLLAPFAPHVAEELWEVLGNEGSIHLSSWPTFDTSKLEEDEVTIAVQINGKTRETMRVARNLDEQVVVDMAKGSEGLKKWIKEGQIKRVIWVKNRLLNLIIDLSAE